MSGICGIVYFDGRKVQEELQAMTCAIQHRGSDGIRVIKNENIGFVHLQLNVSVNIATDSSPIVDKNGVWCVADARIDNRAALLTQLFPSLPSSEAESLGNTALLLAAYAHWGEEMLFHLIGDFAFVLWDESRQKLIAGRDHCAARPLYYCYQPGGFVAFASEIKSLLTLPEVSNEFNFDKIHRYLEWASSLRPYRAETFYKNIHSLPPAHLLTVEAHAFKSRFCWDLKLERFAHLRTDEEFIEAFKTTFLEAVRCRLQTSYPVSAHLSGGLDSSSVCATAHHLLGQELNTLHFDMGEATQAEEKRFAERILQWGIYQHQYITPMTDLMAAVQTLTTLFDRPDHFTLLPTYYLAAAEAIKKQGSRLLLTGHDGDSVVGYGKTYPMRLLQSQRWGEFKELMKQYAQIADFSHRFEQWPEWPLSKRYAFIVRSYTQRYFVKIAKNKEWKRLTKEGWESVKALKMLPFGVNVLLVDGVLNWIRKYKKKQKFIVETDYGFLPEQAHLVADILHEGMLESTEEFEQIAAHYGYEAAHPFYDKRLIELCLVIPDRLKFNLGYGRGPLRAMMKEVLPEEVRLRTSKALMNQPVKMQISQHQREITGLFGQAQQLLPLLFTEAQALILDGYFKRALKEMAKKSSGSIHLYVREIHLAQWLLNQKRS
ncbi:asparagine synthase-related protein [Runella salmonicolor]|uniref:asparagine synthase (glutamine-hydrolyzing) n=1 Tax=Runella salmonicolor TaxID=2950278 RepID=A0ABT1FQD9_9BACT|nr:asparagine synthase-related protein [Runella salmonicolor]MCP1383906.1 asparagine synthase-related protein [Runella salmonicolor]